MVDGESSHICAASGGFNKLISLPASKGPLKCWTFSSRCVNSSSSLESFSSLAGQLLIGKVRFFQIFVLCKEFNSINKLLLGLIFVAIETPRPVFVHARN
jgi:hypothetical protein